LDAATDDAEDAMKEQTVEIGGMTCGHCLRAVKDALSEMAGVTLEEVRLGSARVSYDEAQVKPDAIAEAIRDAGYTVLATH
jgi:copper chaperone